MNTSEKQQVTELNAKISGDLTIRLVDNGDHGSHELKAFCREFVHHAPRIKLVQEEDKTLKTPFLWITPSMAYCGVPSGTEFQPFLELVAAAGSLHVSQDEVPDKSLQAIALPAVLKLYVSSMCPHCPAMVRQIYPLCLMSDYLKLIIIDGPAFPELAGMDNIMSVPTLILDADFRWTASVDVDELLRMIKNRNPVELGVESLKGMIQDGKAYDLADMMIREQKLFPAFVDLLSHPEFSVRLGAMAAIEEVAAKDRLLAGQVVDALVALFNYQEAPIKGDILYVIGECGDGDAVPFLKSVSGATRNSEIREAAEDALASISQADQV